MSSYVRPSIDTPVFRDADGQVIDYGNRWQGPPPEDAYSVDAHPERFAPLHAVAETLIAHIRETYDVEIDEDAGTTADLLHPTFHDVVRAVRMRPRDATCASMTFLFTAYPGISLHAGLLHDPDGGSSGRSRSQDLPAERLRAAKHILQGLHEGWAAWPRSASRP